MGNFNEILFSHEKEGGSQRPQSYIQSFRDILSECALEDLSEVGLLYSVGTPIWHKSQSIGTPGTSTTNPVWKELWKLKILGKVKIFLWRTLHGILPLKCILANRHSGESAEYPICA
jgi:hypothetical protein